MSLQNVGGGGGSTPATNNQYTITGEYPGPSSYPTGGFVVDLSATYSSLNALRLSVKTIGVLPVAEYIVALNSPANGKATVKLNKLQYSRVSSVGNVQNQPSGVTVQASSGQTSSSEASHVHALDHDHGSFTSGAASAAGTSVANLSLGDNFSAHTHTLDLPNHTGNSGAGSSHNHTDNSLYQHQHSVTNAQTDAIRVEIANGTDLSSVAWNLLATGVAA